MTKTRTTRSSCAPPGRSWRRASATSASIGHAGAPDLRDWTLLPDAPAWEVLPPPIRPDALGFGHVEVTQLHRVDDQWLLLFCCGAGEAADAHRGLGEAGDNCAVPVEPPLTGIDIAEARPFEHGSLYAARLHDVDGQTAIIGFRNIEDGAFVGEIADPIPVRWDGERLVRG